MNRQKAEVDAQLTPGVIGKPDEAWTRSLVRRQHEAAELYGLHNYVVLDSLLKRHLHLDKGFTL